MTTREQLEAEAAELYPLDRRQRMVNGEPFPRPEQAAHIRAKTVSAEQVEAAANILAEMNGEPTPGRFERTMARAALTAAGLLIEGEDDE